MSDNAFLKRLENGGNIVIAEGFLFEFERRGYLRAGGFVPEVIIEHPEMVKSVSEEFVHAGSDVVLAFQYYGNREKLKLIGREDDLEKLNRKALEIAKEVARETGTLFGGNFCNTTVFVPNDPNAIKEAEAQMKEQIEWCVEAGVDFILGETFFDFGEALLAARTCKKYSNGIPFIINMTPSGYETTSDGISYGEACRQLKAAGADVVGLNCARGPETMLPLMREIRAAVDGPIACIPVPYRTTKDQPTFQSLINPYTGQRAFPHNLPAHTCGTTEMKDFAEECKKIGVQVIGVCCGNAGHYTREVAMVYGRNPPAARYYPKISEHWMFGDMKHFNTYHTKNIRNAMELQEK